MADATRSLKIVVEEEKRGDGYKQAAKDTDEYADKVSVADLKTKQWAENSKNLQTEISKSKVKIRELREEVAKTGDVSLFGDIRKEETKLRNFEKTLKALAPDVGASFGNSMSTAFSKAFSGGLPGLMPVVIGAVVGLAPLLGAAIGAAVVGVGGIGGVAGGIFAASKDPQVRLAASDLGKHISTSFFSSGSSFVDPIKASVLSLEKDFDQLNLGKTFQLASPFVTEFADGLGGIATEFMPRFNQVLKDGKPAIDLFAQDLPMLGQALGDFGVKLADSKGGLDGVNALFAATTGLIEGTGSALAWLADRYHDINVGASNLAGFLAKVDSALGNNQGAAAAQDDADAFARMSQGAQQGAIHFDTLSGAEKYNTAITLKLGDAAGDAAKQIKEMDDAVRSLFGVEMSVDQANIAVKQGFLDLQKELGKGKQDWRDNTQAGLDHQKMLLDQVGAIQRQRDAAIEAAGTNRAAIDKANAAYETQLQKILAIGKAAGASQSQLQALAGEYDINIVANAVIKGAQAADQLFAQALAAFGVHVGKRAAGGPVMAGQPYIVGEKQAELFVPSQNGYIQSSVSTGLANGGGQKLTVNVGGAPSGALEAMFMQWLVKALSAEVRGQGGQLSVLGLKAA